MADLWRRASAWSNAQLNNDTSKVMSKGANDAWTVVKGVFSTGEPRNEPRPDSQAAKDASDLSGNKSMGGLPQVSSGPHADSEATVHNQVQAARPSQKRNLATQEVEDMTYTDEADNASHFSTKFKQPLGKKSESNRLSTSAQQLQPDAAGELDSMPYSNAQEAKDASVIACKTQQPAPESKSQQQDDEKASLQRHGGAYHNSSAEADDATAIVQMTATEAADATSTLVIRGSLDTTAQSDGKDEGTLASLGDSPQPLQILGDPEKPFSSKHLANYEREGLGADSVTANSSVPILGSGKGPMECKHGKETWRCRNCKGLCRHKEKWDDCHECEGDCKHSKKWQKCKKCSPDESALAALAAIATVSGEKSQSEAHVGEKISGSPRAIDPDRLVQLQDDSTLSPSQAGSRVNNHRDQAVIVTDAADDAVQPTTRSDYRTDDKLAQDIAVTHAVEYAMPMPSHSGNKATHGHAQDIAVTDAVEIAKPSSRHADHQATENPAQDVAVTDAIENAMCMQAKQVSSEPLEETKEHGNEESAKPDSHTKDSVPTVVASRSSTRSMEQPNTLCKHKECSKLNVCQYSAKCTHPKCHNRRECKYAADTTENQPTRSQCGHEDCKELAACKVADIDTSAHVQGRSTCGHEQCRDTDLCELLQAEGASQTSARTACGHDECKDSDLCKLVDGHTSFASTVKPDCAHEHGHASEPCQLIDNNMSTSIVKDDVDSFPAISAIQDSFPVFEKLCKHRECAGQGPCTYNGKCDHIACRDRRECRQSGEDAAQPQTGKPPCSHDGCQSRGSCLLLRAQEQTKRCKHSECQKLTSCQYNAKCAHEGCMNRRECKEAGDKLAPDVPLRFCSHDECMGLTGCLHESSTARSDETPTRNAQDLVEDRGNEVDRLAQMMSDQQAVEAANDSSDQNMGPHHGKGDFSSGHAEHHAHRAVEDLKESRHAHPKKHSKSQNNDTESGSESGSPTEDDTSEEESDSDNDITKHHASHGKNLHFDEARNKQHSHAESDTNETDDTESGDDSPEEESSEGSASDSDYGSGNQHASHTKTLGIKRKSGKYRGHDTEDDTDSDNESDMDSESSSDDGMRKDHRSRPKAGHLKFPHNKIDHRSSRDESDDSSTGDSDDSDTDLNMTGDESGSSSDNASVLASELEDEESELDSEVEDETIPVIRQTGPLAPGTGFGKSLMTMGQVGGNTSRAPHIGLYGSGHMPTPGVGGPQFPQMQPQAIGSPGNMTPGQGMLGFDMGKSGKHLQVKSTKAGKAPKMPKVPKMESSKPMKPRTLPAIQSGQYPGTSRMQTPRATQTGGMSSFSTSQMPSLQRTPAPQIGLMRPCAMPAMQVPQMSMKSAGQSPALPPLQPLRPGQTPPMQMPGFIPGQMSGQMAANFAAQAQMNQVAMINAGIANEANAMVMQAEGCGTGGGARGG